MPIEFEYQETLFSNNNGYWWIDIKCDTLKTWRQELGLSPVPPVPFHITIGKEANT